MTTILKCYRVCRCVTICGNVTMHDLVCSTDIICKHSTRSGQVRNVKCQLFQKHQQEQPDNLTELNKRVLALLEKVEQMEDKKPRNEPNLEHLPVEDELQPDDDEMSENDEEMGVAIEALVEDLRENE